MTTEVYFQPADHRRSFRVAIDAMTAALRRRDRAAARAIAT